MTESKRPRTFDTDVLIIGGGPAGLSCAIALGLSGVRVTVVERKTWPVDKACGEGIMPSGLDVLKRLGVFDRVRNDQWRFFQGVRWFSESGTCASANFASGPGAGIRRTGLSQALFERARELEFVSLYPETRVTSIQEEDQAVEVLAVSGGAPVRYRARVLIGADGRHSIVRKSLKLNTKPPVLQRRWGARQHFSISPWSDGVEVYWSQNIEAYVTPSSEGRVEVAFLWDADRCALPAKGRQLFAGLLSKFPVLEERLRHAPAASDVAAIGPLAAQAAAGGRGRCLLVGDALGYVDGITGEGISVGLLQAEVIGHTLPGVLKETNASPTSLTPLAQRLRCIYRETVLLARLALVLSRHPCLRTLVVRGLSRCSALFTHILEANMGRRSLWVPPIYALPLFVWGVFAPRRRAHRRGMSTIGQEKSVICEGT